MSKTKTPNYTAEMEATLKERYEAAETDEARKAVISELANEFDKSEASVRAKASTMGIYVKPTRTDKTGEPSLDKEELVELIAGNINKPSESLVGLEKANKSTLKVLREATNQGIRPEDESR